MPIVVPIEAQDHFSNVFAKVQQSVANANRAVSKLGGNADSAFTAMAQQAEAATRSTSALSRAFGDFFKQYTAANLALQGFFKVKQALGQAADTIMDFQAKQSTLGAILGETQEGIKEMTERAKDLGRTTVFTASQVSQLQIELSKLGFERQPIQEMTESILQFAQATGGDLGDAAALTGAAIRMFGAETEEANRYTNAMARATTASALDFQAIRDNLATFGPMAHSLGLEIEDVLALFGTLKNAGVEGSTAMTSLRNIFTKVAQGKVPGMEGGVKTLDEFISKLKQIENMSPGDAMKKIGTRGGTQFMTLLQQADQILELRDKIKQASEEDTTGEMAEQMNNNVVGAIKMMQSAWEGFILSFSQSTGPWKDVIDLITAGITEVTNLVSTGSTISKDALYAVMTGLGSLITMYGVRNGVQAITNQLSARQTLLYTEMAAALERVNSLEAVGYRAELQSAVAKGAITPQIASKITMLLAEADAQIAKIDVEKQAIRSELQMVEADLALTEAEVGVQTAEERTLFVEMQKEAQRKKQLLTSKLVTASTNAEAIANQRDAAMKVINAGATGKLKAAMDLLGLSMLTNPYILAAAAIAGVAYGLYSMHEAAMTAEKAQKTLNDAIKEHNQKLKEEESALQNDLKTIQDKNASLYDQYKAYKDLIKLRRAFSGYTQEEIASMSQEQYNSILSRSNAEDERAMAENRVKAIEELMRRSRGKAAAWQWSDRDEQFKQIDKDFNLGGEAIKWGEDISWNTNLNEALHNLYVEAAKQLHESLEDGAYSGLTGGFKKASPEVKTTVATMTSNFSKAIEGVTDKKALYKIGQDFRNQVQPALDEAKKKSEELEHSLLSASGKKKVEIQAELDETNNNVQTLQGLLDLFRNGDKKELVVNIQRNTENQDVGNDFLVELGKEYEEAEKYASAYLANIEKAKEKIQGMSDVSQEEAQKIKEEFGLTSTDLEENVGKLGEKVQDEINQLEEQLTKTKDENERRPIELKIARKKELLDYINTLKTELTTVGTNTWEARVDLIVGKVAPFLKKLLGEDVVDGLSFAIGGNKAKDLREQSQTAQTEGNTADKDNKVKAQADAEAAEEATKEAQKAAEKAAQKRQKQFDLEQKERETQAKQRKATEDAIANANIAQIENDGERERAAQDEQYRKSIQQIKEKEEQMKKENLAAKKSRWEAGNSSKSSVWADTQTAKAGWEAMELTPEQAQQIQAEYAKIEAERKRQLEQRNRDELQAMRDYLKEWGSMEQKRLAITEEYEQKIKDAKNTYEAAGYALQRDEELKSLDQQRLEDTIDWSGVFSELKGHTEEYLVGLRDQLYKLMSSGEITDVEQIATIQGKINDINDAITEQSNSWSAVGDRMREHNRLVEEAKNAQQRLNDAQIELTSAEVNKNLTEGAIRQLLPTELKDATLDDSLLSQLDPKSEEYKQAEKLLVQLRTDEGKLYKARQQVDKATKEATQAEDKAKRNTADKVADWFADMQQKFDKFGISEIPDLFNTLGMEEWGEKAAAGLSAFNNAAGAAADFASGNYVGAAIKGINAINDIGSAFFGDSGFEAATKKWSWLLDSWKENIDYEKELMGKAYGKDVLDKRDKAEKDLDNVKKAALEVYQGWAGDKEHWYSNHTQGHYANEDARWADLWDYDEDLARELGATHKGGWIDGGIGGLFSLTGEQLENLKYLAPQFWSSLPEVAQEYLQTIIDADESLKNVNEAAIKQLTDLDLSTLESQFSDMLNNWDEESKGFSEDFEGYLKNAILKGLMTKTYSKELEKWRENFSKAMDDGLDATEMRDLRDELQDVFDRGKAEYDAMLAAAGLDSSSTSSDQNATASMADKATYDQFELYLGIATAQQIALEQIKSILENWNAGETAPYEQVQDVVEDFSEKVKDITGQLLLIDKDEINRLIDREGEARGLLTNDVTRMADDMLAPLREVLSPQTGTDETIFPSYDLESLRTLQEAPLEQDEMIRDGVLASLDTLQQISQSRNGLVDEIRGLVSISNEYLLDIKKSNREMLNTFGEKIDDIHDILDERL